MRYRCSAISIYSDVSKKMMQRGGGSKSALHHHQHRASAHIDSKEYYRHEFQSPLLLKAKNRKFFFHIFTLCGSFTFVRIRNEACASSRFLPRTHTNINVWFQQFNLLRWLKGLLCVIKIRQSVIDWKWVFHSCSRAGETTDVRNHLLLLVPNDFCWLLFRAAIHLKCMHNQTPNNIISYAAIERKST